MPRQRNSRQKGDVVVSSGMGGIYPSDVNIGRVSDILYQESEISMQVELEPSVDFSRLEYVFVVNGNKKEGVEVENRALLEKSDDYISNNSPTPNSLLFTEEND